MKVIEKFKNDGMTEIQTLYVSYNELTNIIIEKEYVGIDYKRIGLLYGNYKINLSHIMYEKVHKVLGGNKGCRYFVDKKTFNKKNSTIINDLLKVVIQHLRTQTEETARGIIKEIINFIYWMKIEYKNYPKNLEEAISCLNTYKLYLRSLLKNGKIVSATAHYKNKWALHLLEVSVNDKGSEISENVSVIKGIENKSNDFSSTVKTQKELEYSFAFYYNLFDQISDFLIENKDFPYVITLPRGTATLLPIGKIAPSYQNFKNGNIAVNYENGKIFDDLDIENIISSLEWKKRRQKKDNIKAARKNLLKQLDESNNKKNHESRLKLGKRAMDAWFMVMLAIVGMNESSIGTLKWEDELNIEKDEYIFSNIKIRANNKTVTFSIRKSFKKAFEKFLKLRNYVLNGFECEYLFFGGYANNAAITVNLKQGSRATEIYKSFLSLDNKLTSVTSRDYRKDVSNDFVKNKGILVSSAALQHNVSTHMKSYCGETKEEKAEQMESFFTSVHSFVTSEEISISQKSASGNCISFDELIPEAIDEAPITPRCTDPKSCLWCIHYRIHIEEEDIRKLMSIKYIIEEISLPRSEDLEHYNSVMNPWINRIKSLCHEMIEKDNNIEKAIDRIWKEVRYEGLLTPYWLRWLDMLDDLERLS